MKFALSTSLALLAALGYAEQDLKMTSAKNSVLARKNGLNTKVGREICDYHDGDDDWYCIEEELGVLPPDRSCLEWATSTDGECENQWWKWEDACWMEWTDMCQTVHDHWYA